ncbi:MAG TPA: thiamine phosphate synthase [Acidobacteriaceae bacterium]
MRLYAITDRRLLDGEHVKGRLSAAEREGLVRLAAKWAAMGAEYVQLREKDLPVDALTDVAGAMMEAIARRSRLLVNAGAEGAAEAARAVGAAGIHLPGRWHAEEIGRARILGIVSVGCHSVAEVSVAKVAGADIALLSPIFPTASHPNARPLGVEALTQARKAAGKMPVFALGGVNRENAGSCLAAGASGVAGIRTFLAGDWPSQAAQAMPA